MDAAVELHMSPEALRDHLTSRLPAGGHLKSLSLFCTAEHESHVLCLVDVSGVSASAAAVALHGQPFGFNSVVITIPVAEGFCCRNRTPGGTVPAHCTCAPVPPASPGSIPLD
jgi:hypothetical protein